MTEYGTMINNQLIRHKARHDGDKPIVYTTIPTNDFVCTYAWEERTDGIYQVWTITETVIEHEATTSYTEEELTAMTTTELQAICEELGIASSITKANMVELILSKQNT